MDKKSFKDTSKSDQVSCGCSETSSCCSGSSRDSEPNLAQSTNSEKRKLAIDFLFLDLGVCTRCQGSESSLEEAITEASQVLQATGVEVIVNKIHIQNEEQAAKLRFISSPTIRINGRDIQLDVKESLCESCGDICGEDVDCRVWVYQGKEYDIPPKAMIIEAILREIYGGPKETLETPLQAESVPENLTHFFAAKHRKDLQENQTQELLLEAENNKATSSCCSPSDAAVKRLSNTWKS